MSDDAVEEEVIAPIVPGVARALSPLLRRIALDVDGAAGANTYLVGIDEIAVIDPGPAVSAHLDAIAGCGGDRVRWILCTGAADAGGAVRLAALTGAEILGVPGVGPADAAQQLAIGDTVLGTEFRLTVLAAPGVADARVCFMLEEERVLVAGDWLDVDEQGEPTVGQEVVDPAAYVEAVASLRRRRLRGIAPVAGHVIEKPVLLLDKIAPRTD